MTYLLYATLLIGALLLLWLLGSPRISEWIYDRSLFEPDKYPRGDWSLPWLQGLIHEEVHFPTDSGELLHGFLLTKSDAIVTIIINHGNSGNVADMGVLVGLLRQSAANVLLYDYRGFGKSASSATVSNACEDGIAAYDYVSKRFPTSRIVLYGESVGAAISGYVATRRKIAGLILQSAFTDLKTIACEESPFFSIWPKLLYPWPYLSNLTCLSNSKVPLLLLHGALDKDVRSEHSQRLYDCAIAPKKLVMLPNTQHEEINAQDANLFMIEVGEFIQSCIDRANSPELPLDTVPALTEA